MKAILGLILILGGFAIGAYVGLWLMFVGGLIDIINEVKGGVDAVNIGIGVVKMLTAGLVGWLAGIVPALAGVALLKDA